MALPRNDDLANCELSLEELETIAAGGFWSRFEHIAGEVGIVVGKIGFGLAIFGAFSAASRPSAAACLRETRMQV